MKRKQYYYTYQLDLKKLNFLAILLFLFIGGMVFVVSNFYPLLMHFDLITLFLLMFLWLVFHEILHGIGFVIFPEVNFRNITFGMLLERGIFYCMCKQKIGKKTIMVSLLFPVLLIGILTFVIGMYWHHFEIVYLSILNIVGSVGDLVMFCYFLKVPWNIQYLDLDDCTSFTVVSEEDLSWYSVWGIRLVDFGIYSENKMISHDRRRLIISKGSYILILFLLGLLFMKMLGGYL